MGEWTGAASHDILNFLPTHPFSIPYFPYLTPQNLLSSLLPKPPRLDGLLINSALGDKADRFLNVEVGPCRKPNMKRKDAETDEKGLKKPEGEGGDGEVDVQVLDPQNPESTRTSRQLLSCSRTRLLLPTKPPPYSPLLVPSPTLETARNSPYNDKLPENRDVIVWFTKLMRSDAEVAMHEMCILRELAGDRQTKARRSPFPVLATFIASFTKIIVAILTILSELPKFDTSSSMESIPFTERGPVPESIIARTIHYMHDGAN